MLATAVARPLLSIRSSGASRGYNELDLRLLLYFNGFDTIIDSNAMITLLILDTTHNVYSVLIIECYCVLNLLGFNYFMSVRRR